jgi:hypothetical protein
MSYQTGLTQPLLDDVDRRLVQQRNDDMRQIGTNTIFTTQYIISSKNRTPASPYCHLRPERLRQFLRRRLAMSNQNTSSFFSMTGITVVQRPKISRPITFCTESRLKFFFLCVARFRPFFFFKKFIFWLPHPKSRRRIIFCIMSCSARLVGFEGYNVGNQQFGCRCVCFHGP